jgi:hypothetical protein
MRKNMTSERMALNESARIPIVSVALLSVCGLLSPPTARANDLQSGDVLVGAAVAGSFTYGFVAGIQLVRSGKVSIFCQSPTSSADPNFWGIPTSLIVDSQGRAVFLAEVGASGSLSVVAPGVALLRCDGIGATAEKLAYFPNTSVVEPGYTVPVSADGTLSAGQTYGATSGLHLTILNTISLNDLAAGVTSQDAYNFVVEGASGGPPTPIRYLATDQTWEASTDITQTGCCVPGEEMPDVISHSGATYSVNGGYLEKVQDPLRVAVSGKIGGTTFSATLNLFESENTVDAPITYDTITPPIPSGCPPPLSGEMASMPVNRSGFLAPLQAGSVVYDEFTGYGLVTSTDYAPLYPFMANMNEELLDNPGDPTVYFQDGNLGCTDVPFLQFTPPLPWTDPVSGFSNSPDAGTHLASSVGGIVGVQRNSGDVIEMVTGNIATVVASGLLYPLSVSAYPSGYSAGLSTTIVLRVDSSVNILITDPNGKRLGVDSLGNAHNDFTGTIVNSITGGSENVNNGFDSGPGEPRFFGIKNPVPGTYNVQSFGTSSGAYTVHVYSVNTADPTGQAISVSGTASTGSTGGESFTLNAAGNIAFTCASNVSAEVGVVRSGYSYGVITKRYAQTVTLTNEGSSTIAGPISLVLDDLSSNAALYNSAGTTKCAAPLGSPYITLPGPLAPGGSANVVLQFTDPAKTGITYTTRVLAGGVSE